MMLQKNVYIFDISGELKEYFNLYYNEYDDDDFRLEFEKYEDLKDLRFFRLMTLEES